MMSTPRTLVEQALEKIENIEQTASQQTNFSQQLSLAYSELGQIYCQIANTDQQYQRAIDAYHKAIELNPDNIAAYHGCADTYSLMDGETNRQKAIDEYT